tara:strand:+ start:1235 stop:2398 length:1164 start_codon:yes stop_codon:yes gene_type:complete
MYNVDNINKLLNNIIKIVYKKDNSEFNYKSITCSKIIHKNSNLVNNKRFTNKSIYRMFIDGVLIKKNNPFRVHYKCINCDRVNISNLNNIIRKINKNQSKCKMCVNLCFIKRIKQSNYMKSTFSKYGIITKKTKKKSKISTDNFIKNSNNEFEEMDHDYKNDYFNKHLTIVEFNNIKSRIISFQKDKFTNMSDFIYCPTIRIFNQTYFNPYFLDKNRNVLEKTIYIKFTCEKCNNIGFHRDLYIFKNKIKLYCNDCMRCNKTFKIRAFKNINNEKITYQSKIELKFVKYCNKNNILIRDGPKIKYSWNDKDNLRYIVDYYVPDLNYLIELKDMHHWNKQQIKNGKWGCKLNAVNELLTNKTYNKFLLITPKNFVEKTKQIKQNINKI